MTDRLLFRRVVLLVAAACSWTFYAHAESGALANQARIRRDTYGVPHILAETEEAAAFAHGYATAEDHLSDLAALFIRARGQLATIRGEHAVQSDLRVAEFGIYDSARDGFQELPPLMQGILDAYASGYNLYLQEHRTDAPAWASAITGVDVLAHCRAVLLLDFSLDLSAWKSNEPPAQPIASAMWALGRGRTESGHGILLANPHLPWSGSFLFHEVQITVPGRINISGAAPIGFPVVTIGFNGYLGWTHTANSTQTHDLYQLRIDPANANRYLYDGRSLPLKMRDIAISVKTSAGMETKHVTSYHSHHGIVIRKTDTSAVVFKSPALRAVNFLTQYNMMGKARSFGEFRSALNLQQFPTLTIGYADRDGNIYFLDNGLRPVRPSNYRPKAPLAGDTPETEWKGVYPVSELPQILNPKGGYVQNCNDPPWYSNLDQPIDSSLYPDTFEGVGLNRRAQFSLKMLQSSEKFTLTKVMQCLFDRTMPLADRLKPELLAIAKTRTGVAPSITDAVATLENWDNKAEVNSRGALFFLYWWNSYHSRASHRYRVEWDPKDPIRTPYGIGDSDAAMVALEKSAEVMKKEYGTISVAWGDVHRMKRGSLDLPLAGATQEAGSFASLEFRKTTGRYEANFGTSYVLAVEFSNPIKAYSICTYSESSDPKSKHYTDQSQLFATGRLKEAWFTEEEIASHLEREYHPGVSAKHPE